MAYFDSQKNRALWEIELQTLRKLRAEREAGIDSSVPVQKESVRQLSGCEPVRMTYQELLKEEALATRKAPKRERPVVEKAKERQKEARAYEMG